LVRLQGEKKFVDETGIVAAVMLGKGEMKVTKDAKKNVTHATGAPDGASGVWSKNSRIAADLLHRNETSGSETIDKMRMSVH
jgi:hypothetical protein|tara:strand:- start:1040 stop:1285 length:246 start_codon:yes stop_codon:yes gene_type:complete